MLRTYSYRIYPSATQVVDLAKHFGCVRWVYNWGLALKMRAWNEEKKNISCFDLSKELPVMKRAEATEWLGEVTAQSLQMSLKHLDVAYTNFFRKLAKFPKFKKKGNRESFSYPHGVKIKGTKLFLPKIGLMKFRDDRTFNGLIKTTTIVKTCSNKYFAQILVEDGAEPPVPKKYTERNTVGVDLGLIDYVALSNGEKVKNPKFYRKLEPKLKRQSRRLSRKAKGSNNKDKQRLRVAKVYETISNRRKDFLHKLSTRLVRENQAIAVEDLNIVGMMQNRHLAKSIMDAGWSEFINMLKYKCTRAGKTLLQIGRFEPSSKLCGCGVINRALRLSDREWTCRACGNLNDRDVLAAQNIKRIALHPQMQVHPAVFSSA